MGFVASVAFVGFVAFVCICGIRGICGVRGIRGIPWLPGMQAALWHSICYFCIRCQGRGHFACLHGSAKPDAAYGC